MRATLNKPMGAFSRSNVATTKDTFSDVQQSLLYDAYIRGCHQQLAERYPDMTDLNQVSDEEINSIFAFVAHVTPFIVQNWFNVLAHYGQIAGAQTPVGATNLSRAV